MGRAKALTTQALSRLQLQPGILSRSPWEARPAPGVQAQCVHTDPLRYTGAFASSRDMAPAHGITLPGLRGGGGRRAGPQQGGRPQPPLTLEGRKGPSHHCYPEPKGNSLGLPCCPAQGWPQPGPEEGSQGHLEPAMLHTHPSNSAVGGQPSQQLRRGPTKPSFLLKPRKLLFLARELKASVSFPGKQGKEVVLSKTPRIPHQLTWLSRFSLAGKSWREVCPQGALLRGRRYRERVLFPLGLRGDLLKPAGSPHSPSQPPTPEQSQLPPCPA